MTIKRQFNQACIVENVVKRSCYSKELRQWGFLVFQIFRPAKLIRFVTKGRLSD